MSRSNPTSQPDGTEHAVGHGTDHDFLRRLLSGTDLVILALSPRGLMAEKLRGIARALIPLAAVADTPSQ